MGTNVVKTSDEIRELLKATIEKTARYYEEQAKAYRSIVRVRKKDGTDFVNWKHNFKSIDSSVQLSFDDGEWGESTFKISYQCFYGYDRTCYNSLYELGYNNITDRDDNYEEMKKAGRIIKRCEGMRDFYCYTPDEMIEILVKRAERAEAYARLYREDNDLPEIGVEMYEHLVQFLNLREMLDKKAVPNQPTLGLYKPIGEVLQNEILYKIR